MKTTQDIETKIKELKGVGSPSALSKAAELGWVLGLDVTPDEDSDRLTDSLLGSLKPQTVTLEEQIPSFARGHQLYKFSTQAKALKEKVRTTDLTEEEGAIVFGRKFSWENLLGKEGFKKARNLFKKANNNKSYDEKGFYTRIPDEVSDIEEAELISSLTTTGTHRPLLDIDFPATVIPSTTPGHCHLYIDKELNWKDYKKLLNLLADLGIIEHGYRGASLARGYSALRLPWIRKEDIAGFNDRLEEENGVTAI